MTLLTADDVLTVKFEVSSFKEGYKQDEVDVFLDDVTTTIREFEERLGTSQESSGPSHRKAEILLTAEGVSPIACAASVRCPRSATATKMRSWSKVTSVRSDRMICPLLCDGL